MDSHRKLKDEDAEAGQGSENAALLGKGGTPATEWKRKSWVVLALTVLTSSQGILIAWSKRAGHYKYSVTTANCLVEVLKSLISVLLLLRVWQREGVTEDNKLAPTVDEVKVCPVPALLYLIKNLLQYYILIYVDAPSYQILKNLNIVSTGVLYWLFLNRRLTNIQWCAFVLLSLGCTTAQLNPSSEHVFQTSLEGWAMAVVMALLSGFAGVYTEAIMKKKPSRNINVQNFWLYIFGILFNILAIILQDFHDVANKGFFHGYTVTTVCMIVNHALSGLAVSMVMKYADNIVKVYSTSVAMLLTAFVSMPLFGFQLTLPFCLGTMCDRLRGRLPSFTRQSRQTERLNLVTGLKDCADVASPEWAEGFIHFCSLLSCEEAARSMSSLSLFLGGSIAALPRSDWNRGKSVLVRCAQHQQQQERSLDYGEVERILGCRRSGDKMQYLIRWKDEHPETWEPADNVADDVVSEYMGPWWQAARKADADKLRELLLQEEEGERDVDAVDEKGRTALMFAAGLGSEACVRLLVDAGTDLNWQDSDGFTALHIASGYVQPSVVKALVELGADPDVEDGRGRTALDLAQGLLARMPRGNPLHFARRLALDRVLKLLDEASFEVVPVEEIVDKRVAAGNRVEYLVRWADAQPDSWVQASDVSEDLVRNYEQGTRASR